MNEVSLYLCQVEKEKRTRIKVYFEGAVANAILVTCYAPKIGGRSFTWEIKQLNWNLETAKDKDGFRQFILSCQKEDSRNYKIAMEEAIQFNKPPTQSKKLGKKYTTTNQFCSGASSKKTIAPQYTGYVPLVSKEEIITRILQLHPSHLSYKGF